MKLSLVVPCYNEEANVELFFSEVKRVFDGIITDYEIVFVNDGSKDKTAEKLKAVFENNPNDNIQILTLSRNFGKEAAVYAGLCNAVGDAVCLIDADLQQRPEVVVEMYNKLADNPEIDSVAAYQQTRKEGKVISGLKKCFYKLINKIAEVDFVDGASDFRLFRRCVVDAILDMSEYHRFSKGIFSWVGFNTEYTPYEAEQRAHGETKWSFCKLLKYAADGIISFSTLPLKLATGVGFVTAFISIIYLITVIVQKLCFGIDVPGYATIVVLVLFLGGMQLFGLGILGEYISKIYLQVKNRPIYILKEHLRRNDGKD